MLLGVSDKIQDLLRPFEDRQTRWIEGRENDPPPKLAPEYFAEMEARNSLAENKD